MGLFDSVFLPIKCPRCGIVSEMECQTKELDCRLYAWRIGDFVTKEQDELSCIAKCPKCYIPPKHNPYVESVNFWLYPTILLNNGIVTGEYIVNGNRYKHLDPETILITKTNA